MFESQENLANNIKQQPQTTQELMGVQNSDTLLH